MGWMPEFVSRRRFVKLALGSVAAITTAGLGTAVYATQVEPFDAELTQRDLPIEHLPSSLRGQTLVQISDLHIGPTPTAYLAGLFDRVAQLKPSVVVITGDLTDKGTTEQQRELFNLLEGCKLGQLATIATLGNHDYSTAGSATTIRQGLERVGGKLLRNESCVIEGLQIIGLDDLWRGDYRPQDVLPQRDRRAATVVLSHNPDSVDRTEWADYRGWILSGHTHGGQVTAPGYGAIYVPVNNKTYVAGEYALGDGRRLYINRGLGFSKQVRFAARPEITAFTLQRA